MKNYRLWLSGLFCLGLLSCSTSTTYYVDSIEGDDTNTGVTQSAPLKSLEALNQLTLKPGDKVLLKKGSTFWGELEISAQGTSANPVVFDAYGEGELPQIIGDDYSLYAVRVLNSDYVTLQNMEIINTGKKPLPRRTGVWVECKNYGVSHNIRLNNLTIRDVNGSMVKEEGGGSGIYIENGGDSILSRFDSLTIENCHIINCARNAMIWSGYYDRRKWFPNKYTIVRHNLIEGVPGDGIVPIGCDSTLIEYNVMKDSPDVLPPLEAAAGIWPWSCDNTMVQFNEVSGHKAPWDAQGFDSDYNCHNTLIQYNYSHDNYGGMVLICDNGDAGEYSCGNVGTTVRYNLSVGDGLRPKMTKIGRMFSPGIHVAGPVRRTLVERNIVHLNPKQTPETDRAMLVSDSWDGYPDSTIFRQNVFYTAEKSEFSLTKSTHNLWEGNYYLGQFDSIPEIAKNSSVSDFYQKTILATDPSGKEAFKQVMKPVTIKGYSTYIIDKAAMDEFWQRMISGNKKD